MEPTEAQVQRARGAYELGRLRAGALEALRLTPLVVLAFWHCQHPTVTCAASLALMLLVAALRWRGGTWCRAVAPALVAGLPAALLPLLGPWLDGAWLASACGWLCPATGLLAGAMLGSWCRRQGSERGEALIAS